MSLSETVAYIRTYRAGRAAPDGRDGAWGEQATAEAKQWREVGISADDAATLANKGWTAAAVAERLANAPERYSDERDQEAELDQLLYGPGPDEQDA
jgi:hypothetical protein